MMKLYPLKFYEIYKPKIWGGRAIESILSKRLPEGGIGESWELSDHFDDVSVVRSGALEGRSLREIWRAEPEAVLGEDLAARGFDEFPLLVKFIDAQEMLSVQAHPDDEYAEKCDPGGESGKTEGWYVVHAEPGARLVAGLAEGTTREEFRRLLDRGEVEKCLSYLDVSAGDAVHVAAGTVHAVGPGILLCEIQKTSDATYRVWDWGRVGDDGKPRPLHIERALDVIRFDRGPVGKLEPEVLESGELEHWVLDRCDYFVIEKFASANPFEAPPADGRFQILVCLSGSGSIVCGGERYAFATGDTVLFPAALGGARVEPKGPLTLLRTFMQGEG